MVETSRVNAWQNILNMNQLYTDSTCNDRDDARFKT